MPDRSFDRPTGDDDDDVWFLRRDDLVARLRAAPNASRELQRFATALAADRRPRRHPERHSQWLERQAWSHRQLTPAAKFSPSHRGQDPPDRMADDPGARST